MTHKNTRRGFTQQANAVIKNKVILNLIQDLQRVWFSLTNGMRGRFQIRFGMTPLFNNSLNVRGFTLIELLVVVLIIVILAAIALPQYQMAVLKSRYNTLKFMTNALAQAEELYYLEHGTYAEDVSQLMLDFADKPTNKTPKKGENFYYFPWGHCNILSNAPRVGCTLFVQDTAVIGFAIHMKNQSANASSKDKAHAGKARCVAYTATGLPNKLCQKETGQQTADTSAGNWSYWNN